MKEQVGKNGILVVVSAPSGAGKRTILAQAVQQDPNVEMAVSTTTRTPRNGEVDRQDYFFLDRDEFCKRIEDGAFVEWAEVHGNLYGTLTEELSNHLATGKDVVLELDVQGMHNVRALYPDAVTVFVMPPSLEVLEERLRKRHTNTEEDIALRLRNGLDEITACHAFDYIIVNDKLADAVADMQAVIRAARCRASRYAGDTGPPPGDPAIQT